MVDGMIGVLGPLPVMADLTAALTLPVIAMFGAGAVIALCAQTFPRLHYLFTKLRPRQEMAEYRSGQEEGAPPEIELNRLVPSMLMGAVLVGGPYLLDELEINGWIVAGCGIIFAGWLLVWIWRRLNNPPELHQPLLPDATIPQEAVLGALSAGAIVIFALAMLVWVIF
ncbi:hypothetical protein SZ64_15485 [Erythrobacter sp. SG61-1L]|uniref:hypothetical protein n=1 Tax=Erythrobacter sp. SG61-1L TaxID=1603897 RepID=UPI0006C8EDBE|nr:hypothetical protein [Erythrobacter sp. SG61-1L]KPL69387.1 hypothetical protein SZ64_15485 [Erythrobacter sp. SG61-1L]